MLAAEKDQKGEFMLQSIITAVFGNHFTSALILYRKNR